MFYSKKHCFGRKPDLKKVQCFEQTLALHEEVEFLYTTCTFTQCLHFVSVVHWFSVAAVSQMPAEPQNLCVIFAFLPVALLTIHFSYFLK